MTKLVSTVMRRVVRLAQEKRKREDTRRGCLSQTKEEKRPGAVSRGTRRARAEAGGRRRPKVFIYSSDSERHPAGGRPSLLSGFSLPHPQQCGSKVAPTRLLPRQMRRCTAPHRLSFCHWRCAVTGRITPAQWMCEGVCVCEDECADACAGRSVSVRVRAQVQVRVMSGCTWFASVTNA